MTSPLLYRRSLVVLAVALALLAAVVTVRAAAAWTAASAPLELEPASVAELKAALATEQLRSRALEQQIDKLSTLSSDLSGALETARARIVSDGETAAGLSAELAAAAAKLRQLEASLAAARRAMAAGTANGAPAAGPAITPEPHETAEPAETPEPHDDE
jgi:hypothetical protein